MEKLSVNLLVLIDEIMDAILDFDDCNCGFAGVYVKVNNKLCMMLWDDFLDISKISGISDRTRMKIQKFLDEMKERGFLEEAEKNKI